MTIREPENHSANYKIFSLAMFLALGLGWLAVILALTGLFLKEILAVYAILASLYLFGQIHKFRQNIRLSREYFLILALSVLAIAAFSYFTVPSVFSGRDQGSLSNAAIALSQNHKLEFEFPASREFFDIYGPGTALNFPGFNYTAEGKLITHFPVGYISYLAVFYSFFGLAGFVIANGAAFLIFLLSFYLIARRYLPASSAFVSFALILTSFIFSWFFKFTLSENLALALSWFGIWEFIYFMGNRENKHVLFLCFFSFGLLAFARIEAIAIILVVIFILYITAKKEKTRLLAYFPKEYLIALIIMLSVYFLSFAVNRQFYITVIKGFAGAFSQTGAYSGANIFSGAYYLVRVMSNYAILPYIILAIWGIAKLAREKKYPYLFPFLILLPAFIYFINPSISSDHPWMLRRFLFAAVPAAILYSVIFLDSFLKRRTIFYLFSSVLILGNLAIFPLYLPVKINENLLGQVGNISRNFSDNDLVLVDRMATGDPWAMLAGPMNLLYGKQAAYFFNPSDLKKINLKKFDKTYLIIPDENMFFYEKADLANNLVPVKDYSLENSSVFTPEQSKRAWQNNPVELPMYQKKYVYGKIYLLKN